MRRTLLWLSVLIGFLCLEFSLTRHSGAHVDEHWNGGACAESRDCPAGMECMDFVNIHHVVQRSACYQRCDQSRPCADGFACLGNDHGPRPRRPEGGSACMRLAVP